MECVARFFPSRKHLGENENGGNCEVEKFSRTEAEGKMRMRRMMENLRRFRNCDKVGFFLIEMYFLSVEKLLWKQDGVRMVAFCLERAGEPNEMF